MLLLCFAALSLVDCAPLPKLFIQYEITLGRLDDLSFDDSQQLEIAERMRNDILSRRETAQRLYQKWEYLDIFPRESSRGVMRGAELKVESIVSRDLQMMLKLIELF